MLSAGRWQSMKRCLPSSVFSFPAANDYDAFHWIELPTPNQTRIIANQSDNVRSVVPIDHCNAHTHTHTHTSASTCPFFSSQAGRTFIQFFLQSTGTFFCACVCVCVCVCASHIWNEIWCENDARRPVNARCCGRCCRWRFGAIKMRIIHPWSISIYGSRGHALYIGSSRNGVGLGCAKWQIRIVYTRLRFRRTGTLVIDDAWC